MNWDALTEVINKELRNHLGVVERRNEELKLALEVARREMDEARAEAAYWKKASDAFAGHCEEACKQLEGAKADRDAARTQAAGLREALMLLLGSCLYDDGGLTVPSKYVVHGATAALAVPGPTSYWQLHDNDQTHDCYGCDGSGIDTRCEENKDKNDDE